MRHHANPKMSENKKTYEDLSDDINILLCKRKAKWQLSALAWLDYDDVSQMIRLHIFNKWHLWDQKRPFNPWCSQLINNQIINLVRNHYGNYAKPCLRCPSYAGGTECSLTASGQQDITCGDFSKWRKKKEKAYNLKLPLSLDTEISAGNHMDKTEVDYDTKVDRVHTLVMEKLNVKHKEVYKMLFMDHCTDKEVADKFGFKEDSSKRKTPRYKQINNLKKKFYNIAKLVLDDTDIT